MIRIRYKVFAVMKIHILFFWVVTLCRQDSSAKLSAEHRVLKIDSLCSPILLCPPTKLEDLL